MKIELSNQVVPTSNPKVFYIPEFITASEEDFLLRKVGQIYITIRYPLSHKHAVRLGIQSI